MGKERHVPVVTEPVLSSTPPLICCVESPDDIINMPVLPLDAPVVSFTIPEAVGEPVAVPDVTVTGPVKVYDPPDRTDNMPDSADDVVTVGEDSTTAPEDDS